jgi:hypothetical protein
MENQNYRIFIEVIGDSLWVSQEKAEYSLALHSPGPTARVQPVSRLSLAYYIAHVLRNNWKPHDSFRVSRCQDIEYKILGTYPVGKAPAGQLKAKSTSNQHSVVTLSIVPPVSHIFPRYKHTKAL